jgi:hypothetical protein
MLATDGCFVVRYPYTRSKVRLRFVFSANPTRDHLFFYRKTLTKLRPSLDEDKLPLLIFVNKGIEVGTNALTLDIIAETCGKEAARAATFIVRFRKGFAHVAC